MLVHRACVLDRAGLGRITCKCQTGSNIAIGVSQFIEDNASYAWVKNHKNFERLVKWDEANIKADEKSMREEDRKEGLREQALLSDPLVVATPIPDGATTAPVPPVTMRALGEPLAVDSQSEASAVSHSTNASSRRADRRKGKPNSKVCKFFLKGRCKKGKNCDFSHEAPQSDDATDATGHDLAEVNFCPTAAQATQLNALYGVGGWKSVSKASHQHGVYRHVVNNGELRTVQLMRKKYNLGTELQSGKTTIFDPDVLRMKYAIGGLHYKFTDTRMGRTKRMEWESMGPHGSPEKLDDDKEPITFCTCQPLVCEHTTGIMWFNGEIPSDEELAVCCSDVGQDGLPSSRPVIVTSLNMNNARESWYGEATASLAAVDTRSLMVRFAVCGDSSQGFVRVPLFIAGLGSSQLTAAVLAGGGKEPLTWSRIYRVPTECPDVPIASVYRGKWAMPGAMVATGQVYRFASSISVHRPGAPPAVVIDAGIAADMASALTFTTHKPSIISGVLKYVNSQIVAKKYDQRYDPPDVETLKWLAIVIAERNRISDGPIIRDLGSSAVAAHNSAVEADGELPWWALGQRYQRWMAASNFTFSDAMMWLLLIVCVLASYRLLTVSAMRITGIGNPGPLAMGVSSHELDDVVVSDAFNRTLNVTAPPDLRGGYSLVRGLAGYVRDAYDLVRSVEYGQHLYSALKYTARATKQIASASLIDVARGTLEAARTVAGTGYNTTLSVVENALNAWLEGWGPSCLFTFA